MVQEATIADLRKYGFELISVQEPDLMANDPTRVLMRQLMGAVAQYDKSQIVAKLRGARMRKREKEGRCEGRKPFGYYEGEQAAIDRMKALRVSGMGFDRIAAALNAEGVPTRGRGRWRGFGVNQISRHRDRAVCRIELCNAERVMQAGELRQDRDDNELRALIQ
jgi:DNA invertase Pin-like site-specific DNA recombinase